MVNFDSRYKKLNDLGFVGRGKSKHRPRNDPKLYGGPYPFIQTGDVKHSSFYVTEYSQTYNEVGLAQSKLWQPGTLCITIAANIAETAILSFPACFPDSIIGFVADKSKADLKFVKYCLETYKLQMQSISQGTTQDNMSLEKLLSFNLYVPKLETQRKIAAVLSGYDDLIENNKRRIAILEKMAEEIYREWFVRLRFPGHETAKFEKGVPSGWTVAGLETLCVEVRKRTKRKDLTEHVRYVGLEHMPRKSIALTEFAFADSVQSDKFTFIDDDILFGKIRPYLHKIALAPFAGTCSSDIIVLRSLKPHNLGFVLFTAFSESFVDLATVASKGTKMPRADWDFLKRQEMRIPHWELLAEFQAKIDPIFDQLKALTEINRLSVQAKNLLLPRLISGELSVEDLDIQFPPSMIEEEQHEPESAYA